MHACILGMLILQCKINKNRGQGELGIGTALCQEEDSAVVRPHIHQTVIYKCAYHRATLQQPLEGAAVTDRVRLVTECPVHSQNSPPHSTRLHAQGAGTRCVTSATCTSGTWAQGLVQQPDTGQPCTSHLRGVLRPLLPLKRTTPVRAKAVSVQLVLSGEKGLQSCCCRRQPQCHPWRATCLGPAAPFGAAQEALTCLSVTCNRWGVKYCLHPLHRRSSPHTSCIHYSDAATTLNDGIKIRHSGPSKALHPPWKEAHLENPSEEAMEEFLPVGKAAHTFPLGPGASRGSLSRAGCHSFCAFTSESQLIPPSSLNCHFPRDRLWHELKQGRNKRHPTCLQGMNHSLCPCSREDLPQKTRHALSSPEERLPLHAHSISAEFKNPFPAQGPFNEKKK